MIFIQLLGVGGGAAALIQKENDSHKNIEKDVQGEWYVLKAKSHNLTRLLWLPDAMGTTGQVSRAPSSVESRIEFFINFGAA